MRFDLKAALHELYGAGGDERYPFLANLLGLQESDRRAAADLRELSRDSLHRRSLEVVAELLQRLAAGPAAARRLRGPALGRRAHPAGGREPASS